MYMRRNREEVFMRANENFECHDYAHNVYRSWSYDYEDEQ
jgi:hypothetical protein